MKSPKTPHNDVIVISVVITNFEEQTIIIDSKSTKNILFFDVFKIMKLPKKRLIPACCSLYGFNREAVIPIRVITLPIIVGIEPRNLNLMIDFLVMKVPLVYNAILGHPCMKMAQVAVSTFHRVIKFPIDAIIEEFR